MDALKQAENLLSRIAVMADQVRAVELETERELEIINTLCTARTAPLRETLGMLEKDLVSLMKTKKGEIFGNGDTVFLDCGILLYSMQTRVSIPRDALDRIEAEGWIGAVKTAKSVDRSVVEKWPDERLAVIGAQRKVKETYTYELIPPKAG